MGSVHRIGLWQRSDHPGALYSNPIGQLAVCLKQTGDNFYEYVPVAESEGRLQGKPDGIFGQYGSFGDELEISQRDFHLLCAGEEAKDWKADTP